MEKQRILPMVAKAIICSFIIFTSFYTVELGQDQAQPLPDIGVISQEEVVGVEYEQELVVKEIEKPSVEELIESITYTIPDYSGKKTFMSYKLFGSGSKQGQLQQLATTDENGFRKINGRYCIAVGEYFSPAIGQYVDLILDNGFIIPCVIGDVKAVDDTESTNMFSFNGCCSEFLVDLEQLNLKVKKAGDVSLLGDQWKPQVRYIIRYDKNTFKEVQGEAQGSF